MSNKILYISIIIILLVMIYLFANNLLADKSSTSDITSENMSKEFNNMPDLSINKPYQAPEIRDIFKWINSEPLKLEDLKGKVVLIDFWTYSCINCIRTLPYVSAWYEKYKDDGLVVIGVHSPEFAFEKKQANVKNAVEEYDLNYPVAMDNNFSTWRAYNNRYWPAHYFIDRQGNVRHTHFGEGEYKHSEEVIRFLLAENNQQVSFSEDFEQEKQVNYSSKQTPETYLGYQRARLFANSSSLQSNQVNEFQLSNNLKSNYWTLGNKWLVDAESILSADDNAHLKIKFNAKEVYLVMGPEEGAKKIKVMINGKDINELGYAHNDVDSEGFVNVNESRLYEIFKSSDFVEDYELELIAPAGVRMNAFTFGS